MCDQSTRRCGACLHPCVSSKSVGRHAKRIMLLKLWQWGVQQAIEASRPARHLTARAHPEIASLRSLSVSKWSRCVSTLASNALVAAFSGGVFDRDGGCEEDAMSGVHDSDCGSHSQSKPPQPPAARHPRACRARPVLSILFLTPESGPQSSSMQCLGEPCLADDKAANRDLIAAWCSLCMVRKLVVFGQ